MPTWDEYHKAAENERSRQARPAPARRPAARSAGGHPGRLDQDPQPLLPQRRDPDAVAHGPEVRRAGAVAPARAGGLQGGRRDRRPRGQRIHFFRLVGLQDRGLRRDSPQRRPLDRGRRERLHQERRRRADAPPEPRGRQDGQVRRGLRKPGAGDDHDQPGPRAGARRAVGLDRGGQGRRHRASSMAIPSTRSRGASWA